MTENTDSSTARLWVLARAAIVLRWYAVRLPTEPLGIATVRVLRGDEELFYGDGYAIVRAYSAGCALDWAMFKAIDAGEWSTEHQCVRVAPRPPLPVPVGSKVQP